MSCYDCLQEGVTRRKQSSEGKEDTKELNVKEKTANLEEILRKQGYLNVESTKSIPGQNEILVKGDYRESRSTFGVFIIFYPNERIEVSGKNTRAKKVLEEVRKSFPHIKSLIKNSY